MTQEEIQEVLAKHVKWLRGEDDGQCANFKGMYLSGTHFVNSILISANFYGSDLSYIDLSRADLFDADLRCTNLRYANLDYADFRGADFTGSKREDYELTQTPIAMSLTPYYVIIFDRHMEIGCKSYTHEEWENFSDKEIIAMDGKTALEFWRKYKTMLMAACKTMK